MNTRRHLIQAVAAGAGIAAAAMLTATAAVAGPPYVLAANGVTSGNFAATATGTNTTLRNIRSGAVLTCATSTSQASGTLGTKASGAGVAQVTSLTYTNCTGPGGLTFTVTASPSAANPAQLNVSGTTSASGVTPGTISNVRATVNAVLPGNLTCNFLVSGSPTDGNAGATVSGSYTNGSGSTQSTLNVLSGATAPTAQLWINNVTGTGSSNGSCLAGAIQNGDPAQYAGNYTVNATTPANGNPLTVTG